MLKDGVKGNGAVSLLILVGIALISLLSSPVCFYFLIGNFDDFGFAIISNVQKSLKTSTKNLISP